ncbi:YxeA family protein [Lacticaseibacillus daqingensis]|uniref:YxeA family protein n=1 Tax=Lacticaseibacillus daqingensis TaxID=2486014 RepID=UPI000F79B7F8|nr:YxeA family protein [Lacticaseibacillus daqingensis]
MKKVFGILAGLVVVVGLALFGAKLVTAQLSSAGAALIDSFNPLVQEGTVYAKTTQPSTFEQHHTPIYVQTAVDPSGNTRPIRFMGMKVFKQGRYLKIRNKGAHVFTYEAVEKTAVPSAALAKLK